MKQWIVLIVILGFMVVSCRQEQQPVPVQEEAVPIATSEPIPTIPPTATVPVYPDVVTVTVDEVVQNDEVTPNTAVSFTFNQPMNPESVVAAYELTPTVAGEIGWNDDKTHFVFTPEDGFIRGETYMLTLREGMVSERGVALDKDAVWEWSVIDHPMVESREPYAYLLEVHQPVFALKFDRLMDKQSVEAALELPDETAWALRWLEAGFSEDGLSEDVLSEDVLFIEALEPLPFDMTVHFILRETAVDENGVPLRTLYRWSNKTKPLIARITPPRFVDGSPLTVHFNYAIDGDSLHNGIVLEPAIAGQWVWDEAGEQATYETTAEWLPGTTYTLHFEGDVRDADNQFIAGVTSQSFTVASAVTSYIPDGDRVSPQSSVRVTFNRPVNKETVAAAFSMTPAVSGTVRWEGNTFIFEPSDLLERYTDYMATFDSSASSETGIPLFATPYQWHFKTAQHIPAAMFGSGPNVQQIDAGGRRAVQFMINRQGEALNLELYRLSLTQFIDLYGTYFNAAWNPWERVEIDLSQAELTKQWSYADAEKNSFDEGMEEIIIPEDVPPGLYVFNLSTRQVEDQLFLIVSDQTITVKQGQDQLTAWVSDVAGQPKIGSEVLVYDAQGDLLTNGRSDSSGVFRRNLRVDDRPSLIFARNGEDISMTALNASWLTEGSYWWWGRVRPPAKRYTTYIYTDRPIYKPGQTMYYKAIIRRDDDAILSNISIGVPVTVKIRDARNNVVQTVALTSNHLGTVNGSFSIADGAMLGAYKVEVIVNDVSYDQLFKVEDYRKPDYEVVITTDKSDFVDGETINLTVASRYFFDEPVANAQIQFNLYELRERYYWENRDGDDAYIWYEGEMNVRRGRTDENGRLSITLPAELGESPRENWQTNQSYSIVGIEATVNDGSNQPVSSFVVVRVYEQAEQLTLETDGYLHKPDEMFTVVANAQTYFGAPVPNRALTLSLDSWSRNDGDYIAAQSHTLTTGADGKARLPIAVREAGVYRAMLSGRDSLGNELLVTSYLYIFERGYSFWHSGNSDFAVRADQDRYAAGDMATLLIESDFGGPALLTLERGTTRREQLVELTPPITAVEVEIEAEDAPNIYAVVNAWRVTDIESYLEANYINQTIPDATLYTARTNLSVPVTDKRLNVTITPDKETYRPRDEAAFTIRVTNQQGVPVSAELSLAMVDEAIFSLSDELSGPLFDGFYFERDYTVNTYDSLSPIRILLGGFGGGGGGGGLAGGPRSDFPDTAVWYPVLQTDFNGEVVVNVSLPDTITSWRLTAKAITADTQVGETVHNIVTQQPVLVRPILPRTLTAGDEIALSAIVHNYSEESQEIVVSIESQAEGVLRLADDSAQTIVLAAGASRVVGWPVTAIAAGEVEVLVHADIDDVRYDSVLLPVPIRPLAIPDVVTEVGQFTGALATTVTMPEDALPMSEVRIEVSRSIAGSLLEGVEYLTGFPYGCVEQTMSRALPTAVVGRAFFQLGVSNPAAQAQLPAQINASIQRLYGFQHDDGGWGWWFDDPSHDYQTAWVIFGLAVIADAGYEVDADVIERGVSWLNDNFDRMDVRTRAYALYSMAMAGSPNVQATTSFFADSTPELLGTFGYASVALALHEAGESELAQLAVARLLETAVVTDGGFVYWETGDDDGYYRRKTMASSVRSTALVLSALAQIEPAHPYNAGVVRWLMTQRQQQGWGTTNETSYAVLGLTDHLLATSFADVNSETAYTIWLNGEGVATGSLTRDEPWATVILPASDLGDGLNDLRIIQEGPGQLYYVINTRAYLAQAEIEADGVIVVQREYFEAEEDTPVALARPGQLVRVRLTVTMPRAGSYMLVEDTLPGGLEALNENLNSTSRVSEETAPAYYWQRLGYNYKEVYGDRVSFFITDMDEGQRVFEYYARVTHAGAFVAMPAEAYAMYDLTLWGRSTSINLNVIE